MNFKKLQSWAHGYLPLSISLLCAAAIRLFYVFTTPIYNADEGQPFVMAMEFAKLRTFYPLMPLSSIINGTIMKVFGYHFFIGRLVEAVAGIVTVYVTYRFSTLAYNRRIAFVSSILLAFLPLHIIFSFVWKTYGLATLFITLATLFLYQSLILRKVYLSVLGGLMVSLAFLCKTFNLIYLAGGIPLVIILGRLFNPLRKERTDGYIDTHYPIVLLLSSIISLIPVFIWRIKLYGRYFYYDYGMEWVLEAVFSRTRHVWEGMVTYLAATYFIFLPLLIIFMVIWLKEKKFRIINILIMSFIASYMVFTFLNPGHHQSCLIVPVTPLICIAIAYTIDYLLKNKDYIKSALLLTICLVSIFYLRQFYFGKLSIDSIYLHSLLKVSAKILSSYLIIFLCSLILLRILINKLKINKSSVYFERLGQISLFIVVTAHILFAFIFLPRETKRKIISSLGVIEALEYSSPGGITLMYDCSTYGTAMGKRITELSSGGQEDCTNILLGNIEGLKKKHIRTIILPLVLNSSAELYRYITQKAVGRDPSFFQEILSTWEMNRIFDNGEQIVLGFPFRAEISANKDNSYTRNLKAVWPLIRFERTQVFFPIDSLNIIDEQESDFSFSFIISNSGRKNHRYIYEVIESANSLEAQTFYNKDPSVWSLKDYDSHPLWFNNKVMVANVNADKQRNASLEKDVDLGAGEYDIYALLRQAGMNGNANLYFYYNNALINRIPGFVKEKTDRLGWVYVGRVKQNKEDKSRMTIVAKNDDNLQEARAELGRVMFLPANDATGTHNHPPSEFRQAGECIVQPGLREKITISLKNKNRDKSKIDIFVFDQSCNNSYNIYFWNERKI